MHAYMYVRTYNQLTSCREREASEGTSLSLGPSGLSPTQSLCASALAMYMYIHYEQNTYYYACVHVCMDRTKNKVSTCVSWLAIC